MNPTENEQTKLLREILKWIKFAGMKEVKNTLVSTLDNEQKRLAYHMSDGTHGTVEIARTAGIGSTSTIADMWTLWLKLGLGESIPVRGGSRFKRTFDLEDFGIEVPKFTPSKKKEKQKSVIAEKSQSSQQSMEAYHA
jgi:hypothetical protein